MTDTVRLYFRYIAISIRGQMQYRASFLLTSLGQGMATVAEFFAIWALFDRFGSVLGWTLPEVGLFYGVVHTAFALAETVGRGFDSFDHMVKGGDFDRFLVRPRSTALQVASREFHIRCGRLLQALVVLAWSAGALGIDWSVGKVGLLVATIGGGICLFTGLFVLQATMAFWTIESLEIINTLTYGGTETAQFPLAIYDKWFRRFFTAVVPLACISYYPALVILDRVPQGGAAEVLCWLSPLVGVLFLLAALRAWRFGEQHYMSTGS